MSGNLSNDQTSAQCYGIDSSFIERSKLIQKHWVEDSNKDYAILKGAWKNNSSTAIYENYFVVNDINGNAVAPEEVHRELNQLAQATLKQNDFPDYANNVSVFASNSSLGWEYPLLSQTQADEISADDNGFAYPAVLRYAFASSYAYSLEEGNTFSFSDNEVYQSLMLTDGQLTIVDKIINENGVYALAIKVPAIPAQGLEEEIIIAYKGTSNGKDLLEDIELAFANMVETDAAWQKTAYDFCQRVLQKYPANVQSITNGYQQFQNGVTPSSPDYNVVLTGHSLGGYTAVDSGVRTGIQTRVFAAPGTKIIEKYVKWFANTMRLRNSINFRRNLDPVSSSLLRHDENEVEYPQASNINPIANHFLTPFIEDILIPLYRNKNDDKARPTQVFVTPDTTLGAGLMLRLNRWGEAKYPNIQKDEGSKQA